MYTDTITSDIDWNQYALDESLNILWSFEGSEYFEFSHEMVIDFLCENISLSIEEAHMTLVQALSIHERRMDTNFYQNCEETLSDKRWV